ncbi:lytic transglycosylase domain-containing protein [Puniceibacterium sp. IMCC21224]|uniref:lytic transglycosylase domain-containing protein n=1 Tax=Puniceibacterium sp. IMCC21224 TaxID=1618204 RepID=UPI00064DE9C5|nr:lytic transglycosylase domain-containing protein [Puniceibacterium sp. IMCC21224]KMK68341.1 transglycosylase family protein [Puniceibacterium sp. IMCC21224]
MNINRVVAAFLAVFLAISGPVTAEAPAPFPEFSAKRVKVPKPGTKKRITVQIAPQPDLPRPAALPATPAAPSSGRAGGPGRYGWFWDVVSPDLGATGPGRLEPALVKLRTPPTGRGVAAPRLQALQDIAGRHGKDILTSTIGTRVSPALVLAVMSVESGGRADAVSKAGAQGLMQLMPATAERFGVSNSLDPVQNIGGGVRFLDFLMQKFDGDPILVLAGYNAGENSIGQNNGVPPYAETRDYVPKVLSAFDTAKGLCLTQPQLISDGCVFRISQN